MKIYWSLEGKGGANKLCVKNLEQTKFDTDTPRKGSEYFDILVCFAM